MSRPARVGNLLALSLLLGLGVIGFTSSYGGWAFLLPGLGGAAAGLTVGWVGWRRNWSALATSAAMLLAFLLLGGPLALPTTTVAGVIPTLETLRGLLEGGVAGWKQLITTVPPVGSAPPLLVVVFLTGLLGGVVGARLALGSRNAALPVLAPLGVLAAGILVGTRFPVSVLLQGAVFGAVAFGWVAWRAQYDGSAPLQPGRAPAVRRLGGAVAMLTVAGAVAVPLAPALPLAEAQPRFTLREQAQPPVDPATYATPLGSMRKYSTTLRDEVLFTVAGLQSGTALRLAAMDTYDGVVWGVSGSATGKQGSSGAFERIGSQVADPPAAMMHTVDVAVGAYRGNWLPSAGDVHSITFAGDAAEALTAGFRYNRATGTGLSTQPLRLDDAYTMQVTVPEVPNPAEAIELPLGSGSVPSAPAVDAVQELLGALLSQSAEDGPQSFYEQIAALTQGLQAQGYYSNGDTSAGSPPSLSGHGVGRLASFAAGEPLIGDEEQYAATAALMTASLGVPVRVVMGAHAPDGSESGWEVKGSDITTWIEAELGDAWIPFMALPDKNKPLPDAQPAKARPQLAPQQPLPPPPPDTSEAVAASEVEAPEAEEETEQGRTLPAAALVALRVVGIPFLLAILVIGGMAAAKGWRRHRRRSRGRPAARIAGGWAEVTGVARDHGTEVPRGTRRETAAAINAPAATLLADQADAAVFGPDDPSDIQAQQFWADVDAFHRDIRRRLPWHRRLRAVVSLDSWRS